MRNLSQRLSITFPRQPAEARVGAGFIRERTVAAVRAMPDADPDLIAGNTYDHYDEHAAQLRAWRERVGL